MECLRFDDYKDLKDILPPGYDYHLCAYKKLEGIINYRAIFRISIFTQAQALSWKNKFQVTSWNTMKIYKTYPESGLKNEYKVFYRCFYKAIHCPMVMLLTVKRTQLGKRKSRSKDIHLPAYPCMIDLRFNHNHILEPPATKLIQQVQMDMGNEKIEHQFRHPLIRQFYDILLNTSQEKTHLSVCPDIPLDDALLSYITRRILAYQTRQHKKNYPDTEYIKSDTTQLITCLPYNYANNNHTNFSKCNMILRYFGYCDDNTPRNHIIDHLPDEFIYCNKNSLPQLEVKLFKTFVTPLDNEKCLLQSRGQLAKNFVSSFDLRPKFEYSKPSISDNINIINFNDYCISNNNMFYLYDNSKKKDNCCSSEENFYPLFIANESLSKDSKKFNILNEILS